MRTMVSESHATLAPSRCHNKSFVETIPFPRAPFPAFSSKRTKGGSGFCPLLPVKFGIELIACRVGPV
jgi:hypothetical protein